MSRANTAGPAPARAAPVFAALGDPTRLGLVARLGAEGPLSIARLSDGATVTRQAVSKHLTPPPSAVRCLLTAWRVTLAPSLRRAIDSGPSAPRRATRPRRVGSPSAANTGAARAGAGPAVLARDMALDVLHLI